MHYNRENSYLFVDVVKIYKFKAKDSEINADPLFLDNTSKRFSADNIKKTELHGYEYDFSIILMILVLMIFWLFLNTQLKKHDIK